MSGIAAIYSSDGRPVCAERLRRMSRRLAHRGPDAAGQWIDGFVGLAHRAMRTTPESLTERQPILDLTAGIALIMDGRLDARDDLIIDLGDDLVDRGAPDSTLVAAAYRRWGLECFARIIGDFAIVIWDARERRLVGARDTLGIRPFYYRHAAGEFLCASELACIGQELSSLQPNEGMIAECLANRITSKTDTLIEGIHRLPAGHTLVLDQAGLRTFSYWNPSSVNPLRYRNDDEYADHLREVVTRAVKARLRSNGTVGLMVSGGVDSSSVAGIAHQHVASSHLGAGLEMFSLASGDEQDETHYSRQVAARLKIPSHIVPVGEVPSVEDYRTEAVRSLELPTYPSAAIGDTLRERVRQRRIRVLLTGIGGDEWMDGTTWRYADLFVGLRWWSLGREIAGDLRTDYVPGVVAAMKSTLWPLVPPPMRRRIRLARRRRWERAWLTPEFVRRTRLADRLEQHDHGLRFRSSELSDLWHEGVSGLAAHGLEMLDRTGARFGIEHRHPFHDRRVIECAFALPVDQRRWRGTPKRALRRSMAAFLPDVVATRTTNPTFSHVLVHGLNACRAEHAFESALIAELGWIQADRVRQSYNEIRARFNEERDAACAGNLWMVYGIEQWARTVFREEHHGATAAAPEEEHEETLREATSDGVRQRCEADDEWGSDESRIRCAEQEGVPVTASIPDVPRS